MVQANKSSTFIQATKTGWSNFKCRPYGLVVRPHLSHHQPPPLNIPNTHTQKRQNKKECSRCCNSAASHEEQQGNLTEQFVEAHVTVRLLTLFLECAFVERL